MIAFNPINGYSFFVYWTILLAIGWVGNYILDKRSGRR